MKDLREALTNSVTSGRFLEEVHTHSYTEKAGRDQLDEALVQLHNEGVIDVVEQFRHLKNNSENAADFFLARRVFEKALPRLSASVSDVIRCVHHLFREAGQDMAAGHIFDAYIAFCEQDASRPASALGEIESGAAPEDLLTPTLVAGSHLDAEAWLTETLRLAHHSDPELQHRAVFALGKIRWPAGSTAAGHVLEALEEILGSSSDDGLLAVAILSVFEALKRDASLEERAQLAIKTAIEKGDAQVIHAASQLFALEASAIPEPLIDDIIPTLPQVLPVNTGTLENIDDGIKYLLGSSYLEKGLHTLEQMLVQHTGTITMDAFDASARAIRSDGALLNKVATRWLLTGNMFLCQGLDTIIKAGGREDVILQVDQSELGVIDRRHLVFVARKSIGYLFVYPVSPASFIVSLIRYAPDETCLRELEGLLFDPLLINFPGQVRQYLVKAVEGEAEPVAEAVNRAVERLEAYLDELRAVGDIPELSPSVAEREAYNRYHHRIMTESMKEAEKQSVFLSLFPKVVLLYGRRSIHYVSGGGEEAKRMEVPLTEHSVEMEYPRQEHLDPFGLDYTLFVMRAEQIES